MNYRELKALALLPGLTALNVLDWGCSASF
jgi:hypothetical protein